VPDDGGRERIALRESPIPGLTRDPANKNARGAVIPEVTQAETLHPYRQALRPPGYFDGCPLGEDETANVQLIPRGTPPEDARP
jgi:hypothetical protein